MTMKRLLRHTSTLLRTVFLLGAMILVNTQQIQAQVMPDAFETVDPSTIIGNGKFYYIQFYEDLKTTCFDRAYLSDTGAGGELWTKDYIPFAKNILWTLEATGTTNQFRLKSGEGNYIYLDSNDANKYKLTSDQGNATILTFYHRSDGGYEISTAANQNVSMCRDHRNVWAFVANYSVNGDRHTYIGNCLRFAQLKDNVAHIIYYQDVDDFDPNGSGRYTDTWYRPHHYLTYSGSDWTSVIEEGGDNACFLTKEAPATYPTPSVITSGAGRTGSGIVINSPTINQYDHETQFFIRSTKPIPAGKQIYLEFDYKASQNCHVSTQAHGEPGAYQHYSVIEGGLDFTTSWNHYSGSITVSSEMAGTNGMQTIAFNLSMGSETTFNFDNIVMLVDEPDTEHKFISSRSSIYRQYSEWYPTAAAYHQDGLWTLEETGSNGEFSIKKYGGTDNEYITIGYQDVGICYGLGAQSNKATFVLGDYNARRYASLKNTVTNKYVNYTNGDGANVLDMAGSGILSTTGHTWYAGFLPVEVPVPNKDDFYQVVLTFNNGTAMVNETGGYAAYNADNPVLWQIEQVDDYTHFHFRNPKNGKYLVSDGVAVDYYEDARVYSWQDVMDDFVLEWRYVNPVKPETVVPYNVTHKVSYLQQYAQSGLGKQGLATDADSDWKNADGTQKVNLFEITHYVKKGQTIQVGFPTVLNQNNDHIYYQRWYKFGDDTNLEDLQSHVNLSTSADGTVQYYLYNNGMVTGEKLYWETRKEGMKQKALRYFNFTNSDGNAFTVAADVSRYSDFKYEYPGAPLTGDLEEPSLTMRYLFYMKDAKVIAKALTGYPEQAGVADKNVWKETGSVCIDESKWYEKKIFHFPATPLPYENDKWAGYRGEFIGLYHVFSDYWVFNDGDPDSEDDNNLVSAVNNNSEGKIEVRIYDPNGTGIRLGGWNPNIDPKGTTEGNDEDYQGFYFYDKVARNQKTQYGDSRFIVFRYPKDGDGKATSVTNTGKEAYIHVYFNNGGTRYQLAQFTVIFDENSDTRPWTSVNGSAQVKDSNRDPEKLRNAAGRPIAKITFDYPTGETYHYPASTVEGPLTRHNGGDDQYGTIGNSSPIPLKFDKTNYAFDGDGCNWGSYAMVSTKWTQWGNSMTALPANDATYGYGIGPDTGLQSGFLYIDASEQPGDICSADFQGEFCSGDKLMCSGWISGSNRYDDDGEYRCPGGITLTVKGERIEDGQKETIYRFCPGQCYELDNGSGVDGSDGTAEKVVWQQFYFEFGTNQKFKRYWMEVNNNCVSSNGGDFMLDNVEVFALVPEVIPEMNTPVCVNKDVSEMQLLKLNIGFDKILAATNSTEVTDGSAGVKKDISFVFLEKDKFLTKFLEELNKSPLNFGLANIEELVKKIEKGEYENLITTNSNYKAAYKAAFDAAVLGDINKVWDSDSNTENLTAAVLNYHWSTKFTEMETYSFAKAVNGLGSVFRETDTGSGERFIVINGNYPNKLKWKTDTDYYVIPYQSKVTSITDALYQDFNICSACCKKTEFRLDPPI